MLKINALFLILIVFQTTNAQRHLEVGNCDVVIAGGTTAALAAALSASASGVRVCLLEPTDWVGGQLTASAVSAIDFAWHVLKDGNFTLNVAEIDRDERNVCPNFYWALQQLTTNGRCSVSWYCFPPQELLENALEILIAKAGQNLRIWYNTVPKRVITDPKTNRIIQLIAIQRNYTEAATCRGWDQRTSQQILDWYSLENSTRYTKQSFAFHGANVYMDATEWGELLALSGAPYLQGIDEQFDGDTSGVGVDTCGQAFTVGIVEDLNENPTPEPPNPYPVNHPEWYGLEGFSWEFIWTYRRLLSSVDSPTAGDVTLQNWDHGNDYPYGSLFLSKNQTAKTIQDWFGGINISNFDDAEKLAYGWHYWFKENSTTYGQNIVLDKETLGTCTGISKMPYMRDTRRSIGVNGFLMTIDKISGKPEELTGYRFNDSIAIGAYDVDIHPMIGCEYPSYMMDYYPILPYYIPLRALTNVLIPNLMVAGKTIAQSFLVNAGTRLHPVEWSVGTGAGVVAAYVRTGQLRDVWETLDHVPEIQTRVQQFTQICWTINSTAYCPGSQL